MLITDYTIVNLACSAGLGLSFSISLSSTLTLEITLPCTVTNFHKRNKDNCRLKLRLKQARVLSPDRPYGWVRQRPFLDPRLHRHQLKFTKKRLDKISTKISHHGSETVERLRENEDKPCDWTAPATAWCPLGLSSCCSLLLLLLLLLGLAMRGAPPFSIAPRLLLRRWLPLPAVVMPSIELVDILPKP